MLIINSYEEFASHLGEELGTSEWLTVDQDRINMFADATLDHLWNQISQGNNLEMQVNYGMDKMRFGQPVITGSRVRLVTKLHNIADLRGICKAEIEFKMEIEGQRKPALQGISSFLYYFKK